MRVLAAIVLACLCAFGATACTSRSAPARPEPLAAVSPMPNPSLAPWIEEISPTGTADENAQIRIRFRNDVIPVESLESPDRAAALSYFSIAPAIPGRFVFYTPRLVGFEADAAAPLATRLRVTLKAGLADLKGNKLDADLAWTFATTPIAISGLPAQEKGADAPTVDLRPEIEVDSNVALNPASLEERAVLMPADTPDAAPIPLSLVTPGPSPSPASTADDDSGPRSPQAASYVLVPRSNLAKATTYRVVVRAGLWPERGNLAMQSDAVGRIRTYGPLTFTGVEPYDRPRDNNGTGRFISGTPQLDFSNPLADGAAAQITVSPSPRPLALWAPQGSANVQVGGLGLSPNTHYTLAVKPLLRDIYDQPLQDPVTAGFTTGDLAADLWAPTGTTVFPAALNLGVDVASTNLPAGLQAAFHVVKPEELVYTDTADPSDGRSVQLLPPPDSWPALALKQTRGRETITAVPIRQKLGGPTGMLAYGFRARTNQYMGDGNKLVWNQPVYAGLVQLTNLGVFAQWFPHGGIVQVNRLSDGSPVAGAQIAVYESRLDATDHPTPEPCATGSADATGTLQLDGRAFSRCAATATSATDAPSLFVVARSGGDWVSLRTYSWSGGYDDGLNGGWSAGQPDSRGSLIADRWLYQRGETAYFTAVAYFVTDGTLARGRATAYDISLQSPSGQTKVLGKRSPDAFGAFSLEVPIAKDQELGYYTLHAKASNGEELYGSFRVAEFKPPNFNVTLKLDKQFAAEGQAVRAAGTSTYLFGAPVAGAAVQVNVTRQRSYFTPKGWDAWDYGRSWFYPEDEPSVPPDVLQQDAKLDDAGAYALDVPVGTDLPFAMDYQVDFQATDVANVAVSDGKTFTALPSDALILLNGTWVGNAGAAVAIKTAATSPDGKPIAGRRIHLALQKRNFDSATQLVEGAQSPHDSVTYKTVAEADVTSGTEPQTVSLTPPDGGSYRVRANFADAKDDATATDHNLWIAGPGEVDWGGESPNRLVIKLDKKSYRPGELATALVASPYEDAELDFAVVRGGVLYKSRQLVHGASPRVQFRVTEAMEPNAAVEGVLIRRGRSIASGVPKGLDQLARVGFAAFTTSLDDRYLKVRLVPAQASPEPGARQTVRVHLADAAGKPVAGEVALMVVNEAVLQLTGYRPPDLVQMVYAEQPISTRWADSRADVSLSAPQRPEEKGFGYGGGQLAGSGDTRVRTNFKPIAYYDGALETDARGDVSATFSLPDDLTTWRVMALALTRDARFGNADTTFLTTKPLIANPVAPQFARPGDTMNAGVSVTNTAKGTGTIDIAGTLGGGLAFAGDKTTSPTASLSQPIEALTKAYRFPMIVTGTQDGTMRFAAKLGAASDAFEVPLPVRTTDVMESVVTTGTTASSATVPLTVAVELPNDAGGLDATLASTLLPDVLEPVRSSLQDDDAYGMSVASRIGVAGDAVLLAKQYRQQPAAAVTTALAKALTALRALRGPDGGVAAWPGAKSSNQFVSAFAAGALAHAKAAGSADAAAALAALDPALLKMLANPGAADEGCKQEPCRSEVRIAILSALADDGKVRSDFIGQIYAQRDALDTASRIMLARQLTKLPAWADQAKTLRDKLSQNVYETGRTAGVNAFDTGVAAQAQLVRLYVDAREPAERTDRALQALLGLRTNGLWGCPCDNASAMDALVSYASLQPAPPSFTATVRVGGGAAHSAAFQGYAKTSTDVNVPMRDLPRGKTAVALDKTGTGTLHYVVALRYRVAGNAPGRYQGLRIDRIVRQAGSDTVLATYGLAQPQALAVGATQVFEIEDRVVTDHAVNAVSIVDPIPAGFQAVDSTFQTSSQYYQARGDDWQIDYQQIYFDRVEAFASHLEAGVYALHYIVRSVTPGTYAWPAASVYLQYAPEEFGRTSSSTLTVK